MSFFLMSHLHHDGVNFLPYLCPIPRYCMTNCTRISQNEMEEIMEELCKRKESRACERREHMKQRWVSMLAGAFSSQDAISGSCALAKFFIILRRPLIGEGMHNDLSASPEMRNELPSPLQLTYSPWWHKRTASRLGSRKLGRSLRGATLRTCTG